MRIPRRVIGISAGIVVLVVSGCETMGSPGERVEAVRTTTLEDTGTAHLEGDDILVQLSGGPVRIAAAEDTTFFICAGDDCEMVDETTFLSNVDDGEEIRVLGPNAELLSPDAEELPGQVWIVLEQSG